MIRGLYNGMSGVAAQQLALEQISNNMANVNNHGFRKTRASFSDLLYREYQNRRLPVHPRMGALPPQAGKGVRVSDITTDFSQGAITHTGRPLDLAIAGEGLFRVIRSDGTAAYTRQGSFSVDDHGNIVNAAGDYLEVGFTLEDFFEPPVAAGEEQPEGELFISDEGTAYRVIPGEEPREIGRVPLFRFVNTAGLQADRNGYYLETEASGPPLEGIPGADGLGSIRQHCIERSNVDLSAEMVELLLTQRALQSGVRTIMANDELWDITNQLKT